MFENVFKEQVVIEGLQPERAVSRLAKSGICVFHAKKLKKNQILFSVRKKDLEKVFAIYPNICYNKDGGALFSAYTARPAGAVGLYKIFTFAAKRVGLVLGAALFLSVTAMADNFVLKIEKTGTSSYAREVTEILSRHGVRKFAPYPKDKADEICAELLTLDGVSHCSIKKTGVSVKVELRLSPFATATPLEGDMKAAHSGTLLSAAVLRGTLLKRVGEEVAAGETVVGAYFLKEDGEKVETAAIARITLSCTYAEEIAAENEEEAFAYALLSLDGEIQDQAAEKTENGYFVKITYLVTETFNF